jgi:hypothetical protein
MKMLTDTHYKTASKALGCWRWGGAPGRRERAASGAGEMNSPPGARARGGAGRGGAGRSEKGLPGPGAGGVGNGPLGNGSRGAGNAEASLPRQGSCPRVRLPAWL